MYFLCEGINYFPLSHLHGRVRISSPLRYTSRQMAHPSSSVSRIPMSWWLLLLSLLALLSLLLPLARSLPLVSLPLVSLLLLVLGMLLVTLKNILKVKKIYKLKNVKTFMIWIYTSMIYSSYLYFKLPFRFAILVTQV